MSRTPCVLARRALFSVIAGVLITNLPALADLESFLDKSVLTTGLEDATTAVPWLDSFEPRQPLPLTTLPRTDSGGFLLKLPGSFFFTAQSYCLNAGSYAPGSGGEGYLSAPLEGPWADIIERVLERSEQHPEINQREVQTLLWAILARTRLRDLSPRNLGVAGKLLTPREMFTINGGARGMIPDWLRERWRDRLSPKALRFIEARERMREVLTSALESYERLEEIAVLRGDAPLGEGSRAVADGRWSYHPDGYFVRFFPSGYATTRIELSVPEQVSIVRDGNGRIHRLLGVRGERLDITYDSTEPPDAVADEGSQAHGLTEVRFRHHRVVEPKLDIEVESAWQFLGWTLVGIPGDTSAAELAGQWPGGRDRFHRAQEAHEQLEELGRHLGTRRSVHDLLDLYHLATALEALLDDSMEPEHTLRLGISLAWRGAQGALVEWASQTQGTSGGPSPPSSSTTDAPQSAASPTAHSSPVFVPARHVATPGNTSRQRLALSSRAAEPHPREEREDACQRLQKDRDNEILAREVFGDEGLAEAARERGETLEGYQEGFETLMEESWAAGETVRYRDLSPAEQDAVFAPKTLDTRPPATEGESLTSRPQPARGGARMTMNIGPDPTTGELCCTITENMGRTDFAEKYGPQAGEALYEASRAHEETHKASCERIGPREFYDYIDGIDNIRKEEIDAYTKGIEIKEVWASRLCH